MAETLRSERVDVLGVGVDPVSVEELHERIGSLVRSGGRGLIMNVNAHCLNLCYRDQALREILNSAGIVFCDGAGVRLAAMVLGRRIPERITYADWMWQLAAFCEAEGFSLYLLGSLPGVAGKAAERLLERFPSLRIVGAHHGYFDHGPESSENEAVMQDIAAAAPDILVAGLGMPLQERWISENWNRMRVPVGLTGGGVFDYVSGRTRRGPRILTDNGFEWLARLLADPRRLWKRYLMGNPLFLFRVIRQRARRSRRGVS